MSRSIHNGSGLDLKKHPLYKLRLATLITAVVGFVLNFIAIGMVAQVNYTPMAPFMISFLLLVISFTFVLYDLVTYATRKAAHAASEAVRSIPVPAPSYATNQPSDSNNSPHPDRSLLPSTRNEDNDGTAWPSKRLVVMDLILAFLFQFFFWVEFFAIVSSYHSHYWSDGTETFEAYANLTNMVASVLHGIVFWKELMARKHAEWQRQSQKPACGHCGFVGDEEGALEGVGGGVEIRARMDEGRRVGGEGEGEGVAGPSGSPFLEALSKSKITLPKWARGPQTAQYTDKGERDVEHDGVVEPLLATPGESSTEIIGPSRSTSGYGTLEQSIESVPETVVKKKEKGKKRLVDVE